MQPDFPLGSRVWQYNRYWLVIGAFQFLDRNWQYWLKDTTGDRTIISWGKDLCAQAPQENVHELR